jgi:hypothetical protein
MTSSSPISTTTQYPSFASSGLTLSITPSASTSKVLLMLAAPFYTGGRTDVGGGIRMTRASGATIVYPQNAVYSHYRDGGGNSMLSSPNLSFLDSPATTSAVTYSIEFCQSSGSGTTATLSFGGQTLSFIAMEIGA